MYNYTNPKKKGSGGGGPEPQESLPLRSGPD